MMLAVAQLVSVFASIVSTFAFFKLRRMARVERRALLWQVTDLHGQLTRSIDERRKLQQRIEHLVRYIERNGGKVEHSDGITKITEFGA